MILVVYRVLLVISKKYGILFFSMLNALLNQSIPLGNRSINPNPTRIIDVHFLLWGVITKNLNIKSRIPRTGKK